jgi:hypothetical protein
MGAVCSALLLGNKTIHFLITLWYVTQSGFYTKTDGFPRSGWTEMKHQNTPPNRRCVKRRLWSASGITHYKFLNPDEAITEEKHCRGIDRMHQELQRLRPTLVNRKGPILFHDNVRLHVSQMTLQGLNPTSRSVLSRPLSDRLPLLQASQLLPAAEGLQQPSSS